MVTLAAGVPGGIVCCVSVAGGIVCCVAVDAAGRADDVCAACCDFASDTVVFSFFVLGFLDRDLAAGFV